jgi:hypothetical protein
LRDEVVRTRAEQVLIREEVAMTINGMILAVPILAACAFMLTMLYVTIEEAFGRRRDDEV